MQDPSPVANILFPLYWPYSIAPVLSTLSAGLATVYCIINKSYKEALGMMVFAINLSDFLFSLPKAVAIFVEPFGQVYCQLFHGISHFGVLSSVSWSTIFAYALMVMATKLTTESLNRRMKYFIIGANLTALTLVLPTVFGGFIEYDIIEGDPVCVHYVPKGEVEMKGLTLFAIPLLLALTISGVFYAKAAKKLRQLLQSGSKKYLLTLIVYPAIFLLCWIPFLLLNLFIIFNEKPTLILYRSSQALDQMQGFFNGLVYGGSKNLLQKACLKFCKCCRGKGDNAVFTDENENEGDDCDHESLSQPHVKDSLLNADVHFDSTHDY